MSSNAQELHLLDTLERHLARGSYGNGYTLHRDVDILYEGLAQIVSENTSHFVSRALFTSSPAVQIVTRCLLDQAFAALRDGKDFDVALVAQLAELRPSSPDTSPPARWDQDAWDQLAPLSGWEDRWLSFVQTTIRQTMARDEYRGDLHFLEPTGAQISQVTKSLRLLRSLTPALAANTICLVRGYFIVDAEFSSAYNSAAPLMFMINRQHLDDPLELRDTLLHESLHEKMANIRVTHYLLPEGYDDPTSEMAGPVRLPWPRRLENPRKFSVARALATYHYYSHSALLHARALASRSTSEILSSYDDDELHHRFGRAFNRARFIEDALGTAGCRRDLGPDGVRFTEWTRPVLRSLEEAFVSRGRLPAIED